MKRRCLVSGCGELTAASRCATHQRELRRQQGYDRKAWRRLSLATRKAAGSCERCGSTVDLTTDHIEPHRTDAGLRVLCRSCHGSIGARMDRPEGGGASTPTPPRPATTYPAFPTPITERKDR